MKYVIASSKIGTVGDLFVPPAGVNVQALLDGGFIVVEVSTTEPTKPAKNKTKKASKE